MIPQYPHREAVLFEPVYCGGMGIGCRKILLQIK